MDHVEFTIRIAAALVLGAAIGLERQWHHRLAGTRTNALVSTGAAAFVALSGMATGDSGTTRIAAQVVSGVGFLGAGVIFKEGLNIHGLTTAATLWCAAAVGTLAGSGFLVASVIVAALVVAANVLLRPLSHFLDRVPPQSELTVAYALAVTCAGAAEAEVRARLLEAAAQDGSTVQALRSVSGGEAEVVRLEASVVVHRRGADVIERLARRVSDHPGVIRVSWEVSQETHME
jgi:putative Mg2+ transporter-C (MgtC) family protein